MMDYASNMIVVMTIVAAVSMLRLASAKTIVVGGDTGWEIPPTATTYSDWASNQSFTVGDVLVFNFIAGGIHTVAEVTKTAYDGCDTSSIISLHSDSPANITLGKAGQAFFFCSVIGHCDAGMKLAVNVTNGRTSQPPPAPAPAPTPRKAAGSAAATAIGSSSALLPGPLVAALLIAATGLMLNEVHTP